MSPTSIQNTGPSRAGTRGGVANPSSLSLAAQLSVTLPWPPKELSPNFRTRSTRWISRKRKEYREACADAAWHRGVQPGRGLRLDRIIFHPPDARRRDDDNTVARFKSGRDGLAEAMGVDDLEFNTVTPEFGAPVKGGAVVALLSEIPG